MVAVVLAIEVSLLRYSVSRRLIGLVGKMNVQKWSTKAYLGEDFAF